MDGRTDGPLLFPSLPRSAGVPVPLCMYGTCRRQTDGPRPRQSVRHSSPPPRSLSLTRSSRPLVVRPDRRRPSRCRFHRRRRLLLLFALSLSPFSVLRLLTQPVSQSPSRPRRFSKWNLERKRERERERSRVNKLVVNCKLPEWRHSAIGGVAGDGCGRGNVHWVERESE